MQALELASAPDERRVEVALQAGRRRVDLEEPERVDRRALALQLELDRLEAHGVADEPRGLRADQDLARLGDLLQARGDVDGVSDHERVALAGDDLAGVDPDSRLQAEPGHGLDELRRSPHGPDGVVLVGLGDAEDGHDRVPDELLDRPAVPLEDPPRLLVVAPHRRPERLGIEPLAERGRPGEVAEQHGDGLPDLPAPFEGRPAAAAEAEIRRIFLPTPLADHASSLRRRGDAFAASWSCLKDT